MSSSAATARRLRVVGLRDHGLDLNRDQIISFGIVPIHGGRILLGGSMYREVQPVANLKPESIVVHGLRPIDLATTPQLDLVKEDLE